ncbi:hypothetical protein CBR_g978 [Chara braunii]|uniref:Methyltransferase domain-containing protein n=1 Tax=Chara braunii TaxID=69332 RepID=A0A388KCS2_CHABU|nr:hypothetical protein CBR_g978 [Chara braunii]|eukprot:GBG67858.1 hypothetical protein CBR_g978 [Chara braunii]
MKEVHAQFRKLKGGARLEKEETITYVKEKVRCEGAREDEKYKAEEGEERENNEEEREAPRERGHVELLASLSHVSISTGVPVPVAVGVAAAAESDPSRSSARQKFANSLLNATRLSIGTLKIPTPIDEALRELISEYPSKKVKRDVLQLSVLLRERSSGLNTTTDDELMAVDSLTEGGGRGREGELGDGGTGRQAAVPGDANMEFQVLGRRTRLQREKEQKREKRMAAGKRLVYGEKEAVAYLASRAPAVYSSLYRILSEVAMRIPDFRPQRLLDFGSGPGTAVWAASHIWKEEGLGEVTVIDHSYAMGRLRDQVFKSLQLKLAGKVVNHATLQNLSRTARGDARNYDMVIASYVLGEVDGDYERMGVVRRLWSHTKDLLVLVEPGTPQGSATIRQARSLVLQMEKKRLRRTAGTTAHGGSKSTAMEDDLAAEVPEEDNGSGFTADAHVVAPRFDTSAALRGYEDEKFSFVVLRRGSRPRKLEGFQREDFPSTADNAAAFEDLQFEEEGDLFSGDMEEDGAIDNSMEGIEEVEAAAANHLHDAGQRGGIAFASMQQDAVVSEPEQFVDLMARDDLLLRSTGKSGTRDNRSRDLNARTDNAQQSNDDCLDGRHSNVCENADNVTTGAVEEKDEEERGGGEGGGRGGGGGGGEEGCEDMLEARREVAARLWGLPRVVRRPLKRSGHVILDLCMPAAAEGDSVALVSAKMDRLERNSSCSLMNSSVSSMTKGSIQRQVVSRCAQSETYSRVRYKHARKSWWGDLWPF